MPPKRITPAADALIDTLHAEVEALDTLKTLYDSQLEAVRANDPDPIGEHTTQIQEQTAALEDLSQKGTRQARLLSRVLGTEEEELTLEGLVQALYDEADRALGERLADAQTAVSERLQEVSQRRETLRLALEYATDLNHELLVAIQEASSDADGQTYTADGRSEPGHPDRSFVDAVG